MPILFRSTPVVEPFTFDSLGNHWEQDRISRPKGILSTIIFRQNPEPAL